MNTVGIGMIGCGSMGLGIVKRVLKQDPRLRVTAMYDPDPRSIQTTLTAVTPAPVIENNVEALVARPDVDWVMIASWNCFHCDQVVAALHAGKHVFCQKPLAVSMDDTLKMLRVWKARDRMFNIGFTLRYSPHYRKIKSLIDAGTIGEIVSLEFNEHLSFNHGGYIMGDWRRLRANAGTHLLEKCCHDIDLVNWMVGARARRVASFGGRNFFTPENARHIERIGPDKQGRPAYSSWPGLVKNNPFAADKDIVDNQVVILEYENNVRACFHANCNAGIPERRMMFFGTEGTIRADVIAGTIQLQRIGFDTVCEDVSTDASGGHGGGDAVLASELADSMLRGRPPAAGFMDGLTAAVTCFAIDDAMDMGTVLAVNPYWNQIDAGAPETAGDPP